MHSDREQQPPEWRKQLNAMIKNDLSRMGVVVVTWGEEDYKPRTKLEKELIAFIEASHSHLIEEVEKLKMNVDQSVIEYYEDEDVAPRILAHNKAYNQAIDNVISLLKRKGETE